VNAAPGESPPPGVRAARRAMGTRFEIFLPGADRAYLLAAAEEALEEVERLERQLSLYVSESELTGINARAAAGPVQVEPRLFALLETAAELWKETDGAFDPAAGPLVAAWGFVQGSGGLPAPEVLAAARAVSGFSLVELNPEALTVRFRTPGVQLNLGAIGKGYALDRAAELLRDAGIRSGLIHSGTSSVYGIGTPPGAMCWRVALRCPPGNVRSPPETPWAVVELVDQALSVSASHGRAFLCEGEWLGHVIDPRTGQPVRGVPAAAVLHPSGTVSDALSTALLVLGPPGVAHLAAAYPEARALLSGVPASFPTPRHGE